MLKNKIFISLLILITCAFFGQNAFAQLAGPVVSSTDVTITLADMITANYYSQADITVSSDDLASFVAGATGGLYDEGTFTGNSDLITITDAGLSITAAGSALNSAKLLLDNMAAVRGLVGVAESVTFAISYTSATATDGVSNITFSNASYKEDASSVYAASGSLSSVDLSTPVYSDISLDLDLSAVANSGAFSGVTFEVSYNVI